MTFAVTGAASGIGKACRDRLVARGHHVIGIDLAGSDIDADLATQAGRDAMIAAITPHAPEGIDGVVAAAGISAPDRAAQTVSVNYFGAVATLEGLRPMLARRSGRAVAIGSTSALLPISAATVEACLAGDEPAAREAAARDSALSYMSSKFALTRWMRQAAIRPEWAGAGVLLNGVAPGVVETSMTAPLLQDEAMLGLIAQSNPMAVAGFAKPEEIAELIVYLLTFEGHYLVGQMIFIDGGTDAIMRPQAF